MNAVGVRVAVFAQHRIQIRGGQSATAQVTPVHLAGTDQNHQRRIDEPAQGRNQAQSRDDRVGEHQTQQRGGRLQPRGVAGGGRTTDDGARGDSGDPVERREFREGAITL